MYTITLLQRLHIMDKFVRFYKYCQRGNVGSIIILITYRVTCSYIVHHYFLFIIFYEPRMFSRINTTKNNGKQMEKHDKSCY